MPRISVLLFVLCSGAAGCGPSEPPAHEIQGTVTLDGAALPDAQLQFLRSDKTGEPAPARTGADGKYQVKLRPGDYTVRILAQKTVQAPPGATGPSGPAPSMTVDLVPPRYNTNTELKLSVSGPKEENYPLKSK